MGADGAGFDPVKPHFFQNSITSRMFGLLEFYFFMEMMRAVKYIFCNFQMSLPLTNFSRSINITVGFSAILCFIRMYFWRHVALSKRNKRFVRTALAPEVTEIVHVALLVSNFPPKNPSNIGLGWMWFNVTKTDQNPTVCAWICDINPSIPRPIRFRRQLNCCRHTWHSFR